MLVQGEWHMHYGRPEGRMRWLDLQAFERNAVDTLDQVNVRVPACTDAPWARVILSSAGCGSGRSITNFLTGLLR